MASISMTRVALLLLPATAVCGIALVFALPYLRSEPPSTKVASILPAAGEVAPEQDSTTIGKAHAEARALVSALADLPVESEISDGVPTFDIARIEPTGEAVIAGRATPGSTVELLRDGEVHDRAIAGESGQFALVPPKLPPGKYELTLRARRPDGKQASSTQSVAVVIEPTTNERSVAAMVTGSLPATAPKPSEALAARAPRLASASAEVWSAKNSPASVAGPRITTATVSRGDSLWRISQRALGGGPRYSIIYRANKNQIRNPDLIYPGQVFVLSTQ